MSLSRVPYSVLIELGQQVTIKSPFLYLAICGESLQKSVFRRHTAGLIREGIDFCSINRNIKRSYFDCTKGEYNHGKNGFAEVAKNLARYRSKNNLVWISHHLNVDENAAKSFNVLATSLNVN